MRLYNCVHIKICDVMDSYQKLNIKWFIFRFLLPKINQKRLDDSKNEEIWKGQGRFALNMVKNDRTWSKSVEIGSMFNQGNYSNVEGSKLLYYIIFLKCNWKSIVRSGRFLKKGDVVRCNNSNLCKYFASWPPKVADKISVIFEIDFEN